MSSLFVSKAVVYEICIMDRKFCHFQTLAQQKLLVEQDLVTLDVVASTMPHGT